MARPLERPLILNRYRLLETRGEGGFGVVDIAWDTRLQRRVAIKRIPLQVSDTELPGIQEARTAALLNDAHIVQVMDFEVTGTEALIIMENIDGPTLAELLRQSPELLGADAIGAVVYGVAQALECAHENQVLHLDIKPDNILIDPNGRVKVTDFGLSELSGTSGYGEPQGGTIGYMPPEQLQRLAGASPGVDQRTDLWALASLTYQLLTGINPFLAPSTERSLELICGSDIVLPSALRDDLDPEADAIIIQALAADKDWRYATVADFYADLAPWLGDPQAGRRELKALASFAQADEDTAGALDGEKDADVPAQIVLWDRLTPRARGAAARLSSAVACGATAWLGLSSLSTDASQAAAGPYSGAAGSEQALMGVASMLSSATPPELQLTLQLGITALIALAGALVPQLGAVLALLILSAGIYLMGIPLLAAILLMVAAVWWLLIGRRSPADAIIVTAQPLLGALWMPFALPLLAGYLISWKRCWVAALTGGLLMTVVAPLTGSLLHNSLTLQDSSQAAWGLFVASIQQPQTWITLVAWVISALLMGLLCLRGTRTSCFLGCVLATIVLLIAAIGVPWLMGSPLGLGQASYLAACLIPSFIIVSMLILAGVTPYSQIQEEE